MSDGEGVDLFDSDPMAQPLTYPGRIPNTSGVLVDDAYLPLEPVAGKGAEAWETHVDGERVTLASLLSALGCAPMEERLPVVAVGSNASPSQMRRKFLTHSVRPVIPMTLAEVNGIVPGVSAHVNKYGYVPAVPVEAPGETSHLFVLWLDDAEFETLDITEPNYWRRRMPAERHPVTLESGVRLPRCFVYVGKHGCLADARGTPRRLIDQHTLINSLLKESAELRRLCGTTPNEFVKSVHDAAIREALYGLFQAEERVAAQASLLSLL